MIAKVNQHLQKNKKLYPAEIIKSKEYTIPSNQPISIADELRKLVKLNKEGLNK
jgi:hypothetical protein